MSDGDFDGIVRRDVLSDWRTRLLIVVALLGCAVLAGIVMTLSAANRQRDIALERQSHSYEVMILARTLAGTIANSEASLGRYVLSGDKQLGQLYSAQWQRAGDEIDRLDEVTDDAQQQQIDALRAAYHKRGKQLATIALSTYYHRNQQALALYYRAREANALTEINTLLDRIISRERGLLNTRSVAARQSLAHANRVVGLLIAFGVMIVIGAIVLAWLTVSAMAERAIARAETDAERARVEGLERAVFEATEELRHEATERQKTEDRLRHAQKLEAVGQLTGGIAHDFNNMLAVVIGGLELAKRQSASGMGNSARHIDHAMEGAHRAAALTRQLLAFSRAEALLPESVEARTLIAGMSNLLDRTLGDGITVRIRDDPGGWCIWVDRHQLENALLNLAVNARDAMGGRGTLTIGTGQATLAADEMGACAAGEYVTIAVADDGCGMTPDVLERVFEPFFTTKPVGKGTGLGLSQIFGFVRQSDGEIAIASTPGRGTTVTLYLPRHHGTGAIEAETSSDTPEATGPGSLDILVVEDDPRVLAATVAALGELGHRPVACGKPEEAADVAVAQAFDLIVCDVLMPGLTGPEVIESIRPSCPDLAVMFVTGYAGEQASDQLAGHVVLRKPFTLAALERAIGTAMTDERPDLHDEIAAT